MKYIIDTDTMKIIPYEEYTTPTNKTNTSRKTRGVQMVEQLEKWEGAREWDSIVSGIQTWFYGCMSKTSWCATTMSYLLTAAGIPTRRENVKDLYDFAKKSGVGQFFTNGDIKIGLPKTIKRGDILFFLWSGDTMTETSRKHVTMCKEDTYGDMILCIGGNQSDGINPARYDRKYLYGVWRID